MTFARLSLAARRTLPRSLLRGDRDLDTGDEVAAEPDLDRLLAELLDRLVELDLAAVHRDACRGEQLRDLRRGDGAEEFALLARAGPHRERHALDPVAQRLVLLALLGDLARHHALLVLELADVALRRQDRLALREQEVAGEAGSDGDEVAGLAEARHRLAQDQLHPVHGAASEPLARVGQERELARALDRDGERALVPRAVPGDAPGGHLAGRGDEEPQGRRVLVLDRTGRGGREG